MRGHGRRWSCGWRFQWKIWPGSDRLKSSLVGRLLRGQSGFVIWRMPIYPRLLEIIRERTSTLVFVNARRVAERLAGALNELAGEPLARAHHGSLAATQRTEIEELLKAGQIKALVATSSLELGIDAQTIDLVIQIEAPPSTWLVGCSGLEGRGIRWGRLRTGLFFRSTELIWLHARR